MNTQRLFSIRSPNWISFLGSHKGDTETNLIPQALKMYYTEDKSICSSEKEKGALLLWDERNENRFHLGVKYRREERLTTWLQS